MRYLSILVIMMVAIVLIAGCVQQTSKPAATKQAVGPSKINSTVSSIQSIQKSDLPPKPAHNAASVPPLPVKR